MNDKIKINLQMAGAAYTPHHQPRGRGNSKGSCQAGKYPD